VGSVLPQFIKIYDMYGKIVFSKNIGKDVSIIEIQINFKSGMYIVSFSADNNINLFIKKIIIL
jgi:cell fate regulator YaaT (PSP1 superfamily)